MKNKILFILIGLLLYPAIADISSLVDDKLETDTWVLIGIPSYGLTLGLSGRCTNGIRTNGVTDRQYFECGKLNILISDLVYGEMHD